MIGNAINFTEKGGVTVFLKAKGKIVIIDVKDTSNNILNRDSTRLTGLGFYISKLLMQGMSGRIYLKSPEVGKGSTFTVEVPLVKTIPEAEK